MGISNTILLKAYTDTEPYLPNFSEGCNIFAFFLFALGSEMKSFCFFRLHLRNLKTFFVFVLRNFASNRVHRNAN